MKIRIVVGLLVGAIAVLVSCGGESPRAVVLTVFPATATLDQGATQQFTTGPSGASTRAVSWSVQEGSAGGSVSQQGLYTAPAAGGTFHVVAISVADNTKTASAEVSVRTVGVTVSAPVSQVDQGGTAQITATVTGSVNKNVVWSVQEGAAGGSISAEGLYTAPANAGTVHVVATSVADNTKSASFALGVRTVSLAVTPADSISLDQGASQQFTAVVTGSINTGVLWSVQEPRGGSVTQNGRYTAPAVAGNYHVIATSAADNTATAAIAVEVPEVMIAIRGDAEGNQLSACGGKSLQLVADVAGTVETSVIWAVVEPGGGTITSAGLYTAPATSGSFHVIATSVADPSKSYQETIDVGRIWVQVSPATVVVTRGKVRQFEAAVSGCTSNQAVTWSVAQGGGTITAEGFYTASAEGSGSYDVVAASVADAAMTGRAMVQVTAGGFRPSGNMSVRRGFHTATRLLDGEVLVTGGSYVCDFESGEDEFFCQLYDSVEPIPVWSSAERFDPSTGQFRATGAMSTPRMGHAAVLLTDGRVLVVGGSDKMNPLAPQLATAELYDPATESFSSTGSMAVGRYAPTATLLPDGRVLVAGGGRGYPGNSLAPATRSTEIYDPATGSFAPAGDMAAGRTNHTATLLSDSRVLLVGGWAGGSYGAGGASLASSEFFDLEANHFIPGPGLRLERDSHVATLLQDGRVLISGGWRYSDLSGYGGPWAEAEIFDPATESITGNMGMTMPRVYHTATLLPSGQVLVAGGQRIRDIMLWGNSTAELFDPITKIFTPISEMGASRYYGHTATQLLDGRVLLAGGSLDTSAELYVETPLVAGIERISVATDGAQTNDDWSSGGGMPTANGRWVAFESAASNLVPGDTNNSLDIFLRDTCLGAVNCTPSTIRVSVASDGSQAESHSSGKSISNDGRFVVFDSWSANLVPGDTNGNSDVFLRDTCISAPSGCTPSTARVSLADNGAQGSGSNATISASGRYILFYSNASNLVVGDTNGRADVFLRDTCFAAPGCTPSTVRVSVGTDGAQFEYAESYPGGLSADGRFVSFLAPTRLVTKGIETWMGAMVRDTCNGAPAGCTPSTSLISVASDGSVGNQDSTRATLSGSGRYVLFTSYASNLVAGDTNGRGDNFVRDTCFGAPGGCTPSTFRVSVGNDGSQAMYGADEPASMSADGRYVAFASASGNLVPGDPDGWDVFLRDTCLGVPVACTPSTKKLSVAYGGSVSDGFSEEPAINADGTVVVFWSRATNLVPGDTNGKLDVFRVLR